VPDTNQPSHYSVRFGAGVFAETHVESFLDACLAGLACYGSCICGSCLLRILLLVAGLACCGSCVCGYCLLWIFLMVAGLASVGLAPGCGFFLVLGLDFGYGSCFYVSCLLWAMLLVVGLAGCGSCFCGSCFCGSCSCGSCLLWVLLLGVGSCLFWVLLLWVLACSVGLTRVSVVPLVSVTNVIQARRDNCEALQWKCVTWLVRSHSIMQSLYWQSSIIFR
jgi:hypothetical protein